MGSIDFRFWLLKIVFQHSRHFSLRFVQIAHFLVELTKSKLPIEEIRRMNLYVESLSESGMGEGCSKFRHNGLIADLKLGTYCLYCVHNTN